MRKAPEKRRNEEKSEHEKKQSTDLYTFTSNNVSVLWRRLSCTSGWPADTLILQETGLSEIRQIKAAAVMREAGWQSFHGKPTSLAGTRKKAASANNAARGGVAIIVKEEIPTKKCIETQEFALLRNEGRWEEVTVSMEDGHQHVHHATIYGYDGATNCGATHRRNEDMIARALARLLEVGDVPSFLAEDFNIDPHESATIKSLLSRGLIVDIPAAFGLGQQHTFAREGPVEGEEGEGRTRIDTVLTNQAGFAMVHDCKMGWDILNSDHAPTTVTLNKKRFKTKVKLPKLQPAFPKVEAAQGADAKEEQGQKRKAAWSKQWSRIEAYFKGAEDRGDVEAMHRLWASVATSTTKDLTDTNGKAKYKKAHLRAGTAKIVDKSTACPVDPKSQAAASHRQRRLSKFLARLREAAAQTRRRKNSRSRANNSRRTPNATTPSCGKHCHGRPGERPVRKGSTCSPWHEVNEAPSSKTLKALIKIAEKRMQKEERRRKPTGGGMLRTR